jgi:hypothetical protein
MVGTPVRSLEFEDTDVGDVPVAPEPCAVVSISGARCTLGTMHGGEHVFETMDSVVEVKLRARLESERAQHRADIEGFQSALAQEAHEKSILEQVECDLRGKLAEAEARATALGDALTFHQAELARRALTEREREILRDLRTELMTLLTASDPSAAALWVIGKGNQIEALGKVLEVAKENG